MVEYCKDWIAGEGGQPIEVGVEADVWLNTEAPDSPPIIIEALRLTPRVNEAWHPGARCTYMWPGKVFRVVIRPGERALIPRSLRSAVQRTECQVCSERKYDCTNPDHQRVIVGGIAPRRGLALLTPEGEPVQIPVHPQLLEPKSKPATTLEGRLIERHRQGGAQ